MPILQQSAYERNYHILFSMILVVFDMDVAVFAPEPIWTPNPP